MGAVSEELINEDPIKQDPKDKLDIPESDEDSDDQGNGNNNEGSSGDSNVP